ncbi:unnamed protein product [Caenorhabditis sp. 36 PRJEB53466]|nr:unnamed protein product [Caenorhabditis sp. 36 PRJEB53466]
MVTTRSQSRMMREEDTDVIFIQSVPKTNEPRKRTKAERRRELEESGDPEDIQIIKVVKLNPPVQNQNDVPMVDLNNGGQADAPEPEQLEPVRKEPEEKEPEQLEPVNKEPEQKEPEQQEPIFEEREYSEEELEKIPPDGKLPPWYVRGQLDEPVLIPPDIRARQKNWDDFVWTDGDKELYESETPPPRGPRPVFKPEYPEPDYRVRTFEMDKAEFQRAQHLVKVHEQDGCFPCTCKEIWGVRFIPPQDQRLRHDVFIDARLFFPREDAREFDVFPYY